ncbi:hypothetical protein [Pseudomonas sp. NPDC087690]|uniref:hypothetical protein n=1 Tax=Pseudomonas sp. NPDC087690 TaxID=3364446 RepID=UPI00381FB9B0
MPYSTVFRPSAELQGKALSAHTVATFMATQGVFKLTELTSGKAMRRDVLEFLLRKRAIEYWSENLWLVPAKNTTELRLTDAGLDKLEDRLQGRAGAQSVTSSQVQRALNMIFSGSEHDDMEKRDFEADTPFFAVKGRGEHNGVSLFPHRYADGTYVATTSKYQSDYVYTERLDELEALVRSGYGARMSNPAVEQGPSYITHNKIRFSRDENSTLALRRVLSVLAAHDDLSGMTLAEYRKEQALLRAWLLGGRHQGLCVLCGRTMPQELLIAAHIKPRKKASRTERLDFSSIAALMCSLGCDSLFEKGFVYVVDEKIHLNPKRTFTRTLDEAVQPLAGRVVPNWAESSEYYTWHAKQFG